LTADNESSAYPLWTTLSRAGATTTTGDDADVLRRAGFTSHVIEDLLAGLHDAIDIDHLGPKLGTPSNATALGSS